MPPSTAPCHGLTPRFTFMSFACGFADKADIGVRSRTNVRVSPRIEHSRELGPNYQPPSNASHLINDPAFIVALALTGLILFLGFGMTLISGGTWQKRYRARPASTYNVTIVPPEMTSEQVNQHLRLPSDTLSLPQKDQAGIRRNEDKRMLLSVPRSKTWSHPCFAPPLRAAKTSSTRLCVVQEVEEEEEQGESSAKEEVEYAQKLNSLLEIVNEDSRRESWVQHPRQDSDTSLSTDGTELEIEPFEHIHHSGSSFGSSITSLEGDECEYELEETSQDVTEDTDMIYEVKRGQTQSLEIMKGFLVSLSTSVTEEAIPIVFKKRLSVVETRRMDEADTKKIARSKTAPCIQVHKSPAASSAKAKKTEIPALIVTQPSTLSLFTVGSSTSETSIDLGKFPLPPLHLEPSVFWHKLEDEINQSLALQKRRHQ
ncbi:hypothetical protein FA15DRAFT_757893 [Coprinopsis marcescibilis]|uniref:Transmembrane protein n=1 Tax=Coprinopsis marcescibilis TaxID=230819 RepID=A0A5C3KRY5_COPMA|nr:hypothetical protein FA15DRAFT_757893 [Coprinopsis marcescibilis]